MQYQLIRGILDHNLGEQFAPFAVPESGYLVDPVQVVGPEDRVYKNISIAIDLTNVTGKERVTNIYYLPSDLCDDRFTTAVLAPDYASKVLIASPWRLYPYIFISIW